MRVPPREYGSVGMEGGIVTAVSIRLIGRATSPSAPHFSVAFAAAKGLAAPPLPARTAKLRIADIVMTGVVAALHFAYCRSVSNHARTSRRLGV